MFNDCLPTWTDNEGKVYIDAKAMIARISREGETACDRYCVQDNAAVLMSIMTLCQRLTSQVIASVSNHYETLADFKPDS